ncbi:MAG TPA: sigma-70 family RNA polymerase sigma factor [Vicinamibacterales bacterium]|jgi:RNA polymerase sigma-70 factor|nr:sigma-70 family RNA polymerase sigma factor [Vicinamibacterales bacterium]
MIDAALLDRLYARAGAARWDVARDDLAAPLEAALGRQFPDGLPRPREVEKYLQGLHLEDLALACGCAAGQDAAWDRFMAEQRPILYRAADALDPGGRAREIADALYAELYGVRSTSDARSSLFRYFHGRSSLGTWLRAILAQRYVDRLRELRRTVPLPEDAAELPAAERRQDASGDSELSAVIARALRAAIGRLDPSDRLRLRAYHEQRLTLAEIGRITGEHEATVSRRLTRVRKALRDDVEREMREDHRLSEREVREAMRAMMEDPGQLDLRALFSESRGKIHAADRSG